MAWMTFFRSSGASQDLKRTMDMFDGLDDELNDFRKHLEVETIDPDYRQFLLFTLSGAKNYKPCQMGKVDVQHICGENDDYDEVSDPQYELFFQSLKKSEKSYVLEGKFNDVSVYVKYEGESKFGGKREPQRARKMRKDVGRVDGAADQNPRLPSEQAPEDQHASGDVNDRKNKISKKYPDLRNMGIIKESEVGFSIGLSNRMDNLESCKRLKNMVVVQEDNIISDNRGELHGQARLRKPDKGEYMARAHYVPDSESVIRISSDGNGYQTPDPGNNSESENQSEFVGHAQSIKRRKGGSKGKNVVLNEHNLDTKKHLYLKPNPKHNSVTKYQVLPSKEDKEVQSKTKLWKVMKEKNVVTDDSVADRKAVNYRDNELLYPKPSPDNNLEEDQHEEDDQTQSGKKHKVQSQRKLRKVVYGSYEIKVDDTASRNDMAQIENKPLFHKPCPRKNQTIKNCIDQARPKQSHRMLKKVIMKGRDIMDDSNSDVEILDSESFYKAGNPGPFVTSKKFHESMTKNDDIEFLGRISAPFDFRRQLMNVLQKPYDKQECKRLREAFMAGSYVKFHPEVVRKLAVHRHRKGKCLAILRGFFFWLENLTQEGSFKPWKDGQCLGVDPTLL